MCNFIYLLTRGINQPPYSLKTDYGTRDLRITQSRFCQSPLFVPTKALIDELCNFVLIHLKLQ